jgi:hypothetical protein
MEKAPGIQLSEVWESMHSREKYVIIKQLAGFERLFASSKFPAYGSLYYSYDLPSPTPAIVLPIMDVKGCQKSFSIGPTNNRKYFDDGRGVLDLDRGPCKSNWLMILLNSYQLNRVLIGAVCAGKRAA